MRIASVVCVAAIGFSATACRLNRPAPTSVTQVPVAGTAITATTTHEGDLPFDRPPPATLTVGDERQVAGIGTFCWSGGCADMIGIITPPIPLTTTSPVTATLLLPIDVTPSELYLTEFPVTNADQVGSSDKWLAWQPKGSDTTELPKEKVQRLELALEPGLHVLQIGAWFPRLGDVEYGFLLAIVK